MLDKNPIIILLINESYISSNEHKESDEADEQESNEPVPVSERLVSTKHMRMALVKSHSPNALLEPVR
jgi:hypothetical protein